MEYGRCVGSAESDIKRLGEGEDMIRSDDRDGKDKNETPNPHPDPVPAEDNGSPGWLTALNSFLERRFLEADRDTGC